jgi:hypothetical protein
MELQQTVADRDIYVTQVSMCVQAREAEKEWDRKRGGQPAHRNHNPGEALRNMTQCNLKFFARGTIPHVNTRLRDCSYHRIRPSQQPHDI